MGKRISGIEDGTEGKEGNEMEAEKRRERKKREGGVMGQGLRVVRTGKKRETVKKEDRSM